MLKSEIEGTEKSNEFKSTNLFTFEDFPHEKMLY